MAQLTRDLYVPFLDTSKGSGTASYVPIDLSTQFEFSYNPNTETKSYICYKNDTTETTGYAPEFPQEIVLDNTNALYKFMDEYLNSYPVGSDAKIPLLIARPDLTTGKMTVGQLWSDCTVVGDTLNTVDGKLSFTLYPNGDPVNGTVSVTSGKVTFTPKA